MKKKKETPGENWGYGEERPAKARAILKKAELWVHPDPLYLAGSGFTSGSVDPNPRNKNKFTLKSTNNIRL